MKPISHARHRFPADVIVHAADDVGEVLDMLVQKRRSKPAALKKGYGSVATILDRIGSAGRGSPVFEAGTAVGKVLRGLFLLDYPGNPTFRRELHCSLAQGASVHQLQRALPAGSIGAKHGRTIAEIGAISGSLTVLTNIVMMWKTHEMHKPLYH